MLIVDKSLEKYRDRASIYDMMRINDVEVPSLILDREGRELGRIFVENRSIIKFEDIPEVMIQALISGEDSRFMTHDGVDYTGIMRAIYLNVQAGENTQGASTITQQLARNAYDLKSEAIKREESSYERKLVEAFLAQKIERTYSKNEILEFYLNRVPFGKGYYGLRSASLGYFGKEPRDLTIEQCATLVGCIKNPRYMNPVNNIVRSKKARDHVLNRMAIEGFLKNKEAKALKDKPVVLNPKPLRRGTSHLYERVAETVRKEVDGDLLKAGGYKIFTTIDRDAQNLALRAIHRSLDKAENSPAYLHSRYKDFTRRGGKRPQYLQGTVLAVENKTGNVLTYVGGRDYEHSQYDIIKYGRRGVGTAFLPFIYAAGFEHGFSPVSMLLDEPMDNRTVMVGGTQGILAEWGMEIPNPSYEGRITARKALSDSKISASVRFGKDIGLKKVRATAERFGLATSDKKFLPRLLVGWDQYSLTQMVYAYSVIPNYGHAPPSFKVLDRIEDRDGTVVFRMPRESIDKSGKRKVVKETTAWQLHSILSSSLKDGSAGGALDLLGDQQFTGGGKTGTTHTFSDGWFLGYSSEVTCGVWTGFVDGAKPIYEGAFSRKLAMPVWAETMRALERSSPARLIEHPEGLKMVKVCGSSGRRATPQCYTEILDPATGDLKLKSTSYTEYLTDVKKLGICDVHAIADGDPLAALEEFSPSAAADAETRAILAIPIKTEAQVVIGQDPYGARLPSFVKEEDAYNGFTISTGAPLNEAKLPNEDKAKLNLPEPSRLKIIAE